MITFGTLEPFEEDDLNGNCERLLRSAGLWDDALSLEDNEKKLDDHMQSFVVGNRQEDVCDKKRKSALLIAYLTHILLRVDQAAYEFGEPVQMTEIAREIARLYYGSAVMNNLDKHPVPAELEQSVCWIKSDWKQAA